MVIEVIARNEDLQSLGQYGDHDLGPVPEGCREIEVIANGISIIFVANEDGQTVFVAADAAYDASREEGRPPKAVARPDSGGFIFRLQPR